MASSSRQVPRAAGLPSNSRALLIKPSDSGPKVSIQTSVPPSSLIEPRGHNANHTRPEEPNKVVLASVDQRLSEFSRDSSTDSSGSITSSVWTKVSLPSSPRNDGRQNEDGRNIVHRNEQVMVKSNDNNLIWSRIAEVAIALTQEVNDVWSLKIPPIDILSNHEEESDLTREMRAYHLSKARKPSDLPAWLFSDREGKWWFFGFRTNAEPELEHGQRRNLNATDRSKYLKSITDNAPRLRIDSEEDRTRTQIRRKQGERGDIRNAPVSKLSRREYISDSE